MGIEAFAEMVEDGMARGRMCGPDCGMEVELPLSGDVNHKDIGKAGEDAAARYLVLCGFEVLERNWACAGREADIIARGRDGSLHFIEVKTRLSTRCGFPAEAVDGRKRRRYEIIAECYLSTYDGPDAAVSFDIVSVLVLGDRAFLQFVQGAFSTGW